MKFLWSVLVLSTLGLGAALTVPGLSDWALLAAPCLLASAWLLVRERRAAPVLGQVVVDGSNVMHWDRGQPSLDPVKAVIGNLASAGRDPGVIFDANAGYKLADRYLDDRALARLLGLPESRVLVVPKGTPADQYILNAARGLGAKVVSNDRYRDWAAAFPEVDRAGFVIRGGYREGRVWLAEGGEGAGAERVRRRARFSPPHGSLLSHRRRQSGRRGSFRSLQ
ncbi:MAG: hypothetical protein U1E48_05130 [Paracoccaceae bacterium]